MSTTTSSSTVAENSGKIGSDNGSLSPNTTCSSGCEDDDVMTPKAHEDDAQLKVEPRGGDADLPPPPPPYAAYYDSPQQLQQHHQPYDQQYSAYLQQQQQYDQGYVEPTPQMVKGAAEFVIVGGNGAEEDIDAAAFQYKAQGFSWHTGVEDPSSNKLLAVLTYGDVQGGASPLPSAVSAGESNYSSYPVVRNQITIKNIVQSKPAIFRFLSHLNSHCLLIYNRNSHSDYFFYVFSLITL